MKQFDIDDIFKKNIWIWGTGNVADKAMTACLSTANVKGIIDNNVQKQGELYFGHRIVSFDAAAKRFMKDDIIIICCCEDYAKEIEEQLKKRGCENMYCLFEEKGNAELYCYSISKYFFGNCTELGYEERLISRCCTERDFEREDFRWAAYNGAEKMVIIWRFHSKEEIGLGTDILIFRHIPFIQSII